MPLKKKVLVHSYICKKEKGGEGYEIKGKALM